MRGNLPSMAMQVDINKLQATAFGYNLMPCSRLILCSFSLACLALTITSSVASTCFGVGILLCVYHRKDMETIKMYLTTSPTVTCALKESMGGAICSDFSPGIPF